MKDSEISWTHHTFNPWWGCARISPGCVHCYADTLASRWGHELWRRHGPRRAMSDNYWRQPLTWNRKAADTDGPVRVFCASMADVFEGHPEPEVRALQDKERARLWDLIEATPNLTWMLLTKRPENVAGMVPWGDEWPGTAWMGVSAEDQRRADERIPILRSIPAVVRFVSTEPLIGPVKLRDEWITSELLGFGPFGAETSPCISWVICGGESGREARPMRPDWARSLRDQCAAAGVAFHFKQWGEYAPTGAVVARRDTDWHPVEEISRVGKKAAGRLLDGREWNEFPAAVTA